MIIGPSRGKVEVVEHQVDWAILIRENTTVISYRLHYRGDKGEVGSFYLYSSRHWASTLCVCI